VEEKRIGREIRRKEEKWRTGVEGGGGGKKRSTYGNREIGSNPVSVNTCRSIERRGGRSTSI